MQASHASDSARRRWEEIVLLIAQERLIDKTVSGAFAVERRRTTSGAAKRERQAPGAVRRFRYVAPSIAEQRVQRSGSTVLSALFAVRCA